MKFTMIISTENAAFDNYPKGEIEAISNRINARIAKGETSGKAMDTNGNSVGTWSKNKTYRETFIACIFCGELILVDDEVLICQNCGKAFNFDEI